MNTPDVINCILKNEKIKAAQFANKIGAKATQIYDLQSGKTKKYLQQWQIKLWLHTHIIKGLGFLPEKEK